MLFATFRETYFVMILDIKAAKLRKKTGEMCLRSKYAKSEGTTRVPIKVMLRLLTHSESTECCLAPMILGNVLIPFEVLVFGRACTCCKDRMGMGTRCAGLGGIRDSPHHCCADVHRRAASITKVSRESDSS